MRTSVGSDCQVSVSPGAGQAPISACIVPPTAENGTMRWTCASQSRSRAERKLVRSVRRGACCSARMRIEALTEPIVWDPRRHVMQVVVTEVAFNQCRIVGRS